MAHPSSYSLGHALYKPILKDQSIERAKKTMNKTLKVSRNQNIKSIYSNKAVPIKPSSNFTVGSL